jgi:hypothetical protein
VADQKSDSSTGVQNMKTKKGDEIDVPKGEMGESGYEGEVSAGFQFLDGMVERPLPQP